MIQKSLTGSRTGVDACGSEVSPGGTIKESTKAGVGNDTNSGRETNADTIPGSVEKNIDQIQKT